jgi:hypothetical protein
MRTSFYLIGLATASILSAGVMQAGCSSSSSPPATPPANDASVDSGEDAGGACTPIAPGTTVSGVDGGSQWACFQAACGPSLTECSSDCVCNNAILTALECQAGGGTIVACFTPVSTSDDAGTDALDCLIANMTACGIAPLDASTDATTKDASSDAATEAATPEAGPVEAGDQ